MTYSESPRVSDLPDSRRAGHGPCHCLNLNRGREEQFREDNEVDHDAHTQTHTFRLYGEYVHIGVSLLVRKSPTAKHLKMDVSRESSGPKVNLQSLST